MKASQLAVGVAAFLAGGAASFAITHAMIAGRTSGGTSTREELVATTFTAINNGDRQGLLELLIGPASDRIAAQCDDGEHDTSGMDQRRGESVDEALGEAKRKRLVVDHIGDDHAEVVASRGDEIDNHCTARVEVVKHAMEIALHDGKSVHYTAHLIGMELAGRWYLAKIPVAAEVGATPAAPPPPAAEATPPAAAVGSGSAGWAENIDLSQVPEDCANYLRELIRLRACTEGRTRDALNEAGAATVSAIFAFQRFEQGDRHTLENRCKAGLAMLRKGLFGC